MKEAKERWLPYKKAPIKIVKGMDGLWKDSDGTVYSIEEATDSVDSEARCGVGIFSLPKSSPLTAACRSHDHAYSSPTYQVFNSREEADKYLEQQVAILSNRVVAKAFYLLSRIFGASLWENKTNR